MKPAGHARWIRFAPNPLLLALLLIGSIKATPAVTPLPIDILRPALPNALRPERHPRLFVSRDDLATGRHNATATSWGRVYLARQKTATARFVALDDTALRALVPKPRSLFVYGLGMNLDPVKQLPLRWAGWDDPLSMRAVDGKRYPNPDWPDTGAGVAVKSGERYYFIAQANARIMQALEQTVLPALADVSALEGSVRHAHAAAVLLDAIAAVYPTNRRGPLDYPTSTSDFDRGGRLDRPYYQAARGLVNYGFVIDLVAASGELESASAYGGFPIREHVARNLLWDGGTYCHDFAVRGYQLHNGHADYLRGAALVGVLLELRVLAEPMITGPLSLPAMLDVNVDRNGFYYETSPGYASHNRQLYVDMAETLLAMRRAGWRDVPDVYAHPNLKLYLTAPFNRQEVGGHIPTVGDAGPDRSVHDPMRRVPPSPGVYSDAFIEAQLDAAWIQLIRGDDRDRDAAARLLADCYPAGSAPEPGGRRWTTYHVDPETVKKVAGTTPDRSRLETGSAFFGAKGLALLRGGEGSQRYGAQLFFGPGHNHSQREALTWTFFAQGAEWSYAPGYFNKHYRTSWITQSVSHLALIVNGRSHPWENGAARLVAWHATPDVQWAMAAHPDLYDDLKVTRFERLIAQVHNPATGEPAYWLDLGRIDGGEMRDDSFHTQMRMLAADVVLPPPDPARPALFGQRDLGAAVLASDYVAGFDARQFYLVIPGEGYGFLGSPREAPLDHTVRLTLSEPLFATSLSGAKLIVDCVGAPGRRLIVANGGSPHGVPRVPYILQRDRGPGRSAFAKFIRFPDRQGIDPIDRVLALDYAGASASNAFLVTWRDDRHDLWIIGDDQKPGVVTARPGGLPAVSTDAQVALIRFDARGAVRTIRASAATTLLVEGGPQLSSPGVRRGRVTGVGRDSASLQVRWDSPASSDKSGVRPGDVLLTRPPFGASATWEVEAIVGDTVQLRDATMALAQTEMRPLAGKPGEFTFAAGISRFYSGGSRPNTRYALGKAVYAGDTFIGRVRRIESGREQSVTLDGPGVAGFRSPMPVRILEVAEGDEVVVPLDLNWDASSSN